MPESRSSSVTFSRGWPAAYALRPVIDALRSHATLAEHPKKTPIDGLVAARVEIDDTRAGADGDEGLRKGGPRVARAWVGDVRGDDDVRRTTQGRDGRRRIVAPAQHESSPVAQHEDVGLDICPRILRV